MTIASYGAYLRLVLLLTYLRYFSAYHLANVLYDHRVLLNVPCCI